MAVPSVSESASPVVGDDVLLLRLRQGDAGAGQALIQRHCEPLMRYLQRVAGTEVAEELHQQTWLSVLEHIERFDPALAGGGFKSWLFRIAVNKVNDYWRSEGHERAVLKGVRLVLELEMPPADARLELTQETERLRRAITVLPEAQRQVLMLRYYSKLKYAEIARILGCPLNTALGRMNKAMVKLKRLMDDQGQPT